MTDEYNLEVKETLRSYLLEHPKSIKQVLRRENHQVYQYVLCATSWSDQPGRSFMTRVWYILNDIHDYTLCKHDNSHKVTKNIYDIRSPHMDFCSAKCVASYKGTRAKFLNTSLSKYGTKHPIQSSKVMSKIEATNMKRYGVKQVLSCPEIQRKSKDSLEKHKAEDPEFKNEITQKIRNTLLKNYGVDNFMKTEAGKRIATQNLEKSLSKRMTSKMTNFFNSVLCKNIYTIPLFDVSTWIKWHKDKNIKLEWRCRECGRTFISDFKHFSINGEMTYARCEHCHPYRNKSSLEEKNLAKWLANEFKDFIVLCNKEENFKVIQPFQIDILVKDKKTKQIVLAIEYDGAYWHSLEMGSSLFRQLQKTQKCEALGIPLIHIFDDDWKDDNMNQKIKAHLKNIINGNIFASITKADVIQLDRSMFPKTFCPENYFLIDESDPIAVERKSMIGDIFHVPDCGKLTYRKIVS